MRWLMSLGERTRPDMPRFAECPAPDQARALALADDFGQLLFILRQWRQVYGEELTAWAGQVQADDINALPADLITAWEWEGDVIRLDTEPGGYVRVSDYRDMPQRPSVNARAGTSPQLWTTTP
ncbi:hypothetical protein [Streptomyces sp. MA15]|uniref:hypothetical protein n=1 Tax=Streptomyces sp. MA15 TaxID=3055061 RepID=UPI0025AFDBD6|nr:hypothetical protein [Streptomyces sp. MA15]MDN3271569.1 hypothetical protein [Streptomyces sp. MA15]